jgi:hypothetical protein
MTSAPPDFLDRLVDKTFGQQAAIDPRLPSMFEPRAIGPALEPEEPAAVTDADAAPRDGRIATVGGSTRPAQRGVAGDAPAMRRATNARAATGHGHERDLPGHPPAAPFETAEPHGAATAPGDGPWAGIDIAGLPRDAGIADTSPKQTAVPRPDAAYHAPAAAVSRHSPAAEDGEVSVAGTAPSHRPAAATTYDGGSRRPDAIARRQPAAATGERGAGPVQAETIARAARDPGVPLQIEMTDRTLRAPQSPLGEITVVRPTAERDGTPRRAAAPRAFMSEPHAPPGEDAPAPQGALLPVVPPPQRAAFASSPAPQRRNQKAPPHGEAHETPTIVNVTIGRVEVRAGAGAAPRGAEKREPGPLSLADYLKRRSER